MKCVCPMGGDRTCPENCLLATWWNLPPGDRTRDQRKSRAEQMYNQGFTMEAIATQLGVTHKTISNDLREFVPEVQTSRPKGGRPKGSKARPDKRKNTSISAQTAANLILDQDKSYAEVEKTTGFSNTVLRSAVAREEGRRDPQVDRDDLSVTAQQKFDIAIRREKNRLAGQFHQAVNDRVRERIDEIILPHWKEKIERADQLYKHRRGAMDKETFNTIRRALHPDSRHSISDKKLSEAFDTFMSLEKYLLAEKDSPTDLSGLPNSLAEWDAAKQKVTALRRAGKTTIRRAL